MKTMDDVRPIPEQFGLQDEVRLQRVARAIGRAKPASARRVLRAYVAWLKDDRGVSGKGIGERIVTATRLLEDWLGAETACVGRLRRLRTDDVETTLARLSRRCRSNWARRSLRSGTRWFLQFCAGSGWLPPELPYTLPSLSPGRQRWSAGKSHERAKRTVAQVPRASCQRVLRSYVRWLEDVHELATRTLEDRLATALRLLQDWVGAEDTCVRALRRLRVADVEDTFARQGNAVLGKSARLTLQGGMRRFLQFCAHQEWVSPELAAAVPSVQAYQLSTLPRGMSDKDLSRLVAALKPTSPAAMRDRAILLVLATYGVRRGQVAALRLADVDWHRQRITFRAHKGGRTVHHVLSLAVAEALAAYLRQRPQGEAEQVFLRACRPYAGMSPAAITTMIRNLSKRAGITSRPCGPHSLRHAFATRLLSVRQPFKTITDLLGHRSLRSTAIYAKVDRPFLAEVPLEWPEVVR